MVPSFFLTFCFNSVVVGKEVLVRRDVLVRI